ncbi:MAG: hypothetical protein E6K80_07010 [Candidatus Eisenbacteria bacterium]|uniref:Outer membrane protein beta-barrel domain-containing protein n=1 Tax=Eiseniibacteriota bacterium TaxID=2212470 RepID=A0A538U5G6_UNCEI|nr:MAG: hypothetical protein E6K80_07010 [Candidatus Eisenbacteria bacterium]
MRRTSWALVAALLVTASPAFAGGGAKGDFEIGGYGGYGWLDDHGNFRPKDDMLWGGRLGYFVSRHWSFEASGQVLPTKHQEDVAIVTPGLTPETEMHLNGYRFNGLYNFRPNEGFRPFLTAGAGYETFNVEGFGDDKNWGWNAGLGFRLFMGSVFNIRGDGRFVSSRIDELHETQRNVEATLGLGLTFGGGMVHMPMAEAPPNQPPTVTCEVDHSEIHPGESVSIHATATDPDGDPLTYQWSASAGRVVGTASTAAFDFTGATPPANATITVRVSDDHGHTAASDCSVAMAAVAPPPKAEAVSCLAGGFPRNLSRLTNVDKACLDDEPRALGAGDGRAAGGCGEGLPDQGAHRRGLENHRALGGLDAAARHRRRSRGAGAQSSRDGVVRAGGRHDSRVGDSERAERGHARNPTGRVFRLAPRWRRGRGRGAEPKG